MPGSAHWSVSGCLWSVSGCQWSVSDCWWPVSGCEWSVSQWLLVAGPALPGPARPGLTVFYLLLIMFRLFWLISVYDLLFIVYDLLSELDEEWVSDEAKSIPVGPSIVFSTR